MDEWASYLGSGSTSIPPPATTAVVRDVPLGDRSDANARALRRKPALFCKPPPSGRWINLQKRLTRWT